MIISVSVNKEAQRMQEAIKEKYGKLEISKIYRIGLRTVCKEGDIGVEKETDPSIIPEKIIPEI